MAAADRAAALWLPLEASRWYREALWLATALGLPAAERAAVARSSYETSVGTLTVESYEAATAALALYEEADELMAGAARSWLIIPTFQQGRLDEALALGRQALDQLEPFGETRELAAALRQLGQVVANRGHGCRRRGSRRAEAIARDVGARDIQAQEVQEIEGGLVGGECGLRVAHQDPVEIGLLADLRAQCLGLVALPRGSHAHPNTLRVFTVMRSTKG